MIWVEEDWEILVLMKELEMPLFSVFQKNETTSLHLLIRKDPALERREVFSMQMLLPALDLSSSQRLY